MKKPTLLDDWREIKDGWSNPDFRWGFLRGFFPSFALNFLICAAIVFIPLCFSIAHLNQICEEHQHGLTSVEILGVGSQHSAG